MYEYYSFKVLLTLKLNVILRLPRDRPGQLWLYTVHQTWTPPRELHCALCGVNGLGIGVPLVAASWDVKKSVRLNGAVD